MHRRDFAARQQLRPRIDNPKAGVLGTFRLSFFYIMHWRIFSSTNLLFMFLFMAENELNQDPKTWICSVCSKQNEDICCNNWCHLLVVALAQPLLLPMYLIRLFLHLRLHHPIFPHLIIIPSHYNFLSSSFFSSPQLTSTIHKLVTGHRRTKWLSHLEQCYCQYGEHLTESNKLIRPVLRQLNPNAWETLKARTLFQTNFAPLLVANILEANRKSLRDDDKKNSFGVRSHILS